MNVGAMHRNSFGANQERLPRASLRNPKRRQESSSATRVLPGSKEEVVGHMLLYIKLFGMVSGSQQGPVKQEPLGAMQT